MKVTPFFVLFFFFSCSSLERIDIYRLGPLKLIRHNIEHAGDGHVVRECLDSYLFEIPLEYDTQKVHKNTKHFGDIKRIVEATYKGKIIYSKALSSANLPIKIHLKDLPIAPKDSSIDIEVYVLKKASLIEWPKQVFYTARTYSLGLVHLDIVALGAREWDYARTQIPEDRNLQKNGETECWNKYKMCNNPSDGVEIKIEDVQTLKKYDFGNTILTKTYIFPILKNETAIDTVHRCDSLEVFGLSSQTNSERDTKLVEKGIAYNTFYGIKGGEIGNCRAPLMVERLRPIVTNYFTITCDKVDSFVKRDTFWISSFVFFPQQGCSTLVNIAERQM